MNNPQNIFDRKLLRSRRRRAAPLMRGHEFLLDRFLNEVEERLSLIQRNFTSALVLGAQGGSVGPILHRRGLNQVVEVDPVFELLPARPALGVVADEEALPFAGNSFDLVIAPLTLQFVNDLPGTLLQIRSCLRPDGLFIGGMFGGATLQELRQSWIEAEAQVYGGASPRVAPFADLRDLGGLLQRAGFALPVVDVDSFRVRYDSALALMFELRAMGAGNVLADRRRVPVSRRLLRRAGDIYAERFVDPDGRIPATFEMLIMTAWAPHESQQRPLQPGSASVRLADALGVKELRAHDRES